MKHATFRTPCTSSKSDLKTKCGGPSKEQKEVGHEAQCEMNERKKESSPEQRPFHVINYHLDVNSILANSMCK